MKRVGWLFLSIVGVSLLTGCWCNLLGENVPLRIAEKIRTGPAQRETYHVDPDGTEQVDVTVQFGGGTLDVQGGSSDLLSAEFVYNLDDLAPEVAYKTSDNQGELVIRQQIDGIRWDPSIEVRNEWQLSFGDRKPLDMNFEIGASQGTLALGGLQLTHLRLDAGAADVTVRFDKPNPERLESMQVRSGAARIDLLYLGNANLDELWFDGGLGAYTFDFRGEWQGPSTVHIQAGASQVSLLVPRDIGIKVCPGDLRGGDYDGLQQDGDCHVNDLYGHTDIQLNIDVNLGLGELQVKQVD
jgi:uncharacterized protein DUF2154